MARTSWNRRSFFKLSGAAAASAWLGGCGGGDDDDALGTEQQLRLDATQAVAAIREGRLDDGTERGVVGDAGRPVAEARILGEIRPPDCARQGAEAAFPRTSYRLRRGTLFLAGNGGKGRAICRAKAAGQYLSNGLIIAP